MLAASLGMAFTEPPFPPEESMRLAFADAAAERLPAVADRPATTLPEVPGMLFLLAGVTGAIFPGDTARSDEKAGCA